MATAQNDPNVKIPPAIARIAAAADAAFHAANGTAAPPAEVELAPVAADAPPPVVTPEVTPPAPAPIDWEHRFNSMKGREAAAQNNNRILAEQITALQAQLANAPVAPAPETPNELLAASLLTPEEVVEYGAEFLDVVKRAGLEKVSPEMAAIKKELDVIRSRLEGDTVARTANARNTMIASLDSDIAQWRDVNVSPEFHSWLALPDMMSGVIRHQLLSAAFEQNNTPRVAAFFNGFLAQEAALAPAPDAEPALTDENSGKIPLESLAAPGRAKTAATPPGGPVEKPILTSAQVSKFFADSAAGKYRGNEAEKNRIDAMIVEAGRDGRIR